MKRPSVFLTWPVSAHDAKPDPCGLNLVGALLSFSSLTHFQHSKCPKRFSDLLLLTKDPHMLVIPSFLSYCHFLN